jgi:hypothetical protein
MIDALLESSIYYKVKETRDKVPKAKINRGYYTAARRYDFYLRVVKTILFLTREDKSHIFKPPAPCNVLFII